MFVLAMVKILRSFEISYFHGDTVYQPNFIQYQLLLIQNGRIFYVETKILTGHRTVNTSSILVIV